MDTEQAVTLVQCTQDPERLIVKIARVSNPNNEQNWDTGPKLLRYLIKHKHWSPFEHSFMTVKIQTELDIAAQLCRHRSFTFQQYSQRYAVASSPKIPEFRRQDTTNRQNSFDDLHPDPFTQQELQVKAQKLIRESYDLYEYMLQRGVAKETARRVLPVATPTTLYMSGSARSFIHYIQIRAHPDTQLEHRLVAEQIKQIFCTEFPITAEALEWKL